MGNGKTAHVHRSIAKLSPTVKSNSSKVELHPSLITILIIARSGRHSLLKVVWSEGETKEYPLFLFYSGVVFMQTNYKVRIILQKSDRERREEIFDYHFSNFPWNHSAVSRLWIILSFVCLANASSLKRPFLITTTRNGHSADWLVGELQTNPLIIILLFSGRSFLGGSSRIQSQVQMKSTTSSSWSSFIVEVVRPVSQITLSFFLPPD